MEQARNQTVKREREVPPPLESATVDREDQVHVRVKQEENDSMVRSEQEEKVTRVSVEKLDEVKKPLPETRDNEVSSPPGSELMLMGTNLGLISVYHEYVVQTWVNLII